MRVIAGTARSLPLKSVPDKSVRPTTDKTKETLFNILQPYINSATFLDLYAGSGAIGIEALSRGAKRAVFVEQARPAQRCIEENLRFTKFEDRSVLLRGDVDSYVSNLSRKGEKFDLIFLDPPYESGKEKETLRRIAEGELLAEGGIIIVEASKFTEFDYVNKLGLSVWKNKEYKKSRHLFLVKKADPSGGER